MSNPITVSKFMHSPADKVWAALTDKEQTKQWYFEIPNLEPKEGTFFDFYEPGGKKEFHHHCKVIKVVPNKIFSHTWTYPEKSTGISIVTWTLEPKADGTQVTLTHEGTENFAGAGPEFIRSNYEMGWDAFVNTVLRNYLHGIKTLKFSETIYASADSVWQTLWQDETYRKWTTVFNPGSHISGEVKEGSRIKFIGSTGDGIYSDVIFMKENKLMLFRHIGLMKNNIESLLSDKTLKR